MEAGKKGTGGCGNHEVSCISRRVQHHGVRIILRLELLLLPYPARHSLPPYALLQSGKMKPHPPLCVPRRREVRYCTSPLPPNQAPADLVGLVVAVAVRAPTVAVAGVAEGGVPDSAPEVMARALSVEAGRSRLLGVLRRQGRERGPGREMSFHSSARSAHEHAKPIRTYQPVSVQLVFRGGVGEPNGRQLSKATDRGKLFPRQQLVSSRMSLPLPPALSACVGGSVRQLPLWLSAVPSRPTSPSCTWVYSMPARQHRTNNATYHLQALF